ncbi:MAG: hypothetical protein R6U38_02025 [Desulfatiglandaceae bacterium]
MDPKMSPLKSCVNTSCAFIGKTYISKNIFPARRTHPGIIRDAFILGAKA